MTPNLAMNKTGYVRNIIYKGNDTGFAVIRLNNYTITKGILPGIRPGEKVEISGNWISDSYGKSFEVKNFRSKLPNKPKWMQEFLSSFNGVGPKTAKAMVDTHGKNIYNIIDNEPGLLVDINGIGSTTLSKLKTDWDQYKQIRNIRKYLIKHNAPIDYVMPILSLDNDDPIGAIKNNPYSLLQVIDTLTFEQADNIAIAIGGDCKIAKKNASVLYLLTRAKKSGHTFQYKHTLLKQAKSLTGVPIDDRILQQLSEEQRLIIQGNRIYNPELYKAERTIERLVEAHYRDIGRKKPEADTDYTDEQKQAIIAATKHNGLILTGGAGTGKTYAIKGIIEAYNGKNIMLTATTGKAANRITKVTDFEAQTIHRFLGYNPSAGEYKYNQDNKIPHDLLVIDEASMIDTILLQAIMQALSSKTTLVLSGDPNQLPSIDPGNILQDVQKSPFPVVKLTRNLRQDSGSDIIDKANQILNGEMPAFKNTKSDTVGFVETVPDRISEAVTAIITEKLPSKYNPLRDIQVITPFNKGAGGVDELNYRLQQRINFMGKRFHSRNGSFAVGDKVMQIRNEYDKGVFNGDIGYICSVDKYKQEISVEFEERIVEYSFNEANALELAYACSVHKSQGHDYPLVIMALPEDQNGVLNRNLLYTALTRAEEGFIFVGMEYTLASAVKRSNNRRTSLFDSSVS